MIELRTDFETVEQAVAYITSEVKAELDRLAGVEGEKAALLAKRDELLDEVKSVRAAKTAAETKAAELESKATEATGSEAELARFRQELEGNFNAQLEALKAEREAEKAAAAEAKLRADALAELSKAEHRLHDAQAFFNLHGSKLVRDPDSGNLYVKGTGQTVAQYVQDVEQQQPFLFKPKGGSGVGSQGSGAGTPGSTYSGSNPFKPETLDITAQGRLFKENRALFERLKAEAGK
jgi:hypothetical protein